MEQRRLHHEPPSLALALGSASVASHVVRAKREYAAGQSPAIAACASLRLSLPVQTQRLSFAVSSSLRRSPLWPAHGNRLRLAGASGDPPSTIGTRRSSA